VTARPLPDLVGTSFSIDPTATIWGQTVAVNYAIANRGSAITSPFDVELRLSADQTIDAADVLLRTFQVNGLAADATASGTISVALPSAPPPGFTTPENDFLGFRIDPTNAIREKNEPNNANQGLGKDRASLQVLQATSDTEPNNTLASANFIG